MRNHCSRLNQQGGKLISLEPNLCGFSPEPECRWGLRLVYESSKLLVSDIIPPFKFFREWLCEGKVRLRVSVAPDMSLCFVVPCQHAGNGNESLFSMGFIHKFL
ncbi:hypothetical protein ILYODFUR_029848 [Ilyodon furcidens]|uniref:Uncharacterized protein n=1 Tax=Ilyodon furcidens TaxID=33524 RepID=A0ABV0T1C5_9TELE